MEGEDVWGFDGVLTGLEVMTLTSLDYGGPGLGFPLRPLTHCDIIIDYVLYDMYSMYFPGFQSFQSFQKQCDILNDVFLHRFITKLSAGHISSISVKATVTTNSSPFAVMRNFQQCKTSQS